jgi:Helix-hairpin-helix motif
VKRSTKAIIGGFCLGTILIYGWRWYSGRRRIRNFHLTNDDLNYSDRSAEELASAHLIDLNSASADQLMDLGLSAETQERLIENRPYRSKLELLSRMILSQDEYAAIKDRVSIAEANESVKIA